MMVLQTLNDLMTYDIAIEMSKPRGKTSADIFEVSLLSDILDVKDDSVKTDRLAQITVWWGIIVEQAMVGQD